MFGALAPLYVARAIKPMKSRRDEDNKYYYRFFSKPIVLSTMSTTGSRQLNLFSRKKKKAKKGLTKEERAEVKTMIDKDKETKTKEQSVQNTQEAWSATTRVIHLSPIAIGDGDHDRDGLDVRLKRLKYRLHLQQVNTNQRVIRVTFLRWFFDDAPTAADLYTTGNIQRPITESFYDRHAGQIISDKIYNIDQYRPQMEITGKFKLPYKCSFSGDNHDNYSRGQIWCVIGSDVTDTASNFDFASILFYKDM